MCWSSHHTCMEKECWESLSKDPCGLSRSHKWELLVLLTPSLVKWASSVYRILRIQRQDSNRLPMSAGSGCRMHWIWQGYKRSVRNVHRILLRSTLRRAEILRVVVCVLFSTTAPMFLSSSDFVVLTWTPARSFALSKETLSRRYCWPRLNRCQSEIRRWGYLAEFLQEQQ